MVLVLRHSNENHSIDVHNHITVDFLVSIFLSYPSCSTIVRHSKKIQRLPQLPLTKSPSMAPSIATKNFLDWQLKEGVPFAKESAGTVHNKI